MGDRSYTRFSVPFRIFKGQHGRRHLAAVAQAFGLLARTLKPILAQAPHDEEAGYNNGIAVRLVQGCPCLVLEDDDCNYGGSIEESALLDAHIPFIRVNDAGHEYGPSRTVSDGRSAATVRLDNYGTAMVGVHIDDDGKMTVDDEELDEIRRAIRLTRSVLRQPRIPNVSRANKRHPAASG